MVLAAALAVAPGAQAAPRVIVIGLDAVSFNLLDPYMQSGVTPNIKAVVESGARGDLASYWPLRTPQIWTSVVTGKLPGQHNIWDHVSNSAYNPPPFATKERKQVTSKDRKSKALWQILSQHGLSSLVVGWISSWPAESMEKAVIAAPFMPTQGKRQVSIKGSFFRDAPDQVAPPSLWPRVQSLIVEPQDVSAEELSRWADVPPAGHPLYSLPLLEKYAYSLRWSIARGKSVEAITTALAAEQQPDVVLTYFQCADTLLHRFWIFSKSEEEIRERLAGHGIPSKQAAELKRRFGNVVEMCYRDMDERVGRILAATRGPESLVILLSDHGFGEAPKPHPSKDEPYGGNHRDDGFIVVAGSDIAAGSQITGSVLDITPTILYALNLPVGADMRGQVMTSLFPAETLVSRPIQTVPSYEAEPQTDAPFSEGYPKRKQRPLAVDK